MTAMTPMTAVPHKYSPHLKPHETDKMGHVPFDFQKMSFTIDALKRAKLKKKFQKLNSNPHIRRHKNTKT